MTEDGDLMTPLVYASAMGHLQVHTLPLRCTSFPLRNFALAARHHRLTSGCRSLRSLLTRRCRFPFRSQACELLIAAGADASLCNVGGYNAADIAPAGSPLQTFLFDILSAKFSGGAVTNTALAPSRIPRHPPTRSLRSASLTSERRRAQNGFFGSYALVAAAEAGDASRAQTLLSMRANPNSHNGTHSAMQRACVLRRMPLVKLLLVAGASPHLAPPGTSIDGATGSISRSLLKREDRGLGALHLAARSGPLQLVLMLLEVGADPYQESAGRDLLPVECVTVFRTQVPMLSTAPVPRAFNPHTAAIPATLSPRSPRPTPHASRLTPQPFSAPRPTPQPFSAPPHDEARPSQRAGE